MVEPRKQNGRLVYQFLKDLPDSIEVLQIEGVHRKSTARLLKKGNVRIGVLMYQSTLESKASGRWSTTINVIEQVAEACSGTGWGIVYLLGYENGERTRAFWVNGEDWEEFESTLMNSDRVGLSDLRLHDSVKPFSTISEFLKMCGLLE